MNNTQLLQDAAKAAGYELYYWGDGTCMRMSEPYDAAWNPIESDEAAFRLMVDCEVRVKPFDRWVTACKKGVACGHETREFYDLHNNDKHAATRMAIVRAAVQSQEGV